MPMSIEVPLYIDHRPVFWLILIVNDKSLELGAVPISFNPLICIVPNSANFCKTSMTSTRMLVFLVL